MSTATEKFIADNRVLIERRQTIRKQLSDAFDKMLKDPSAENSASVIKLQKELGNLATQCTTNLRSMLAASEAEFDDGMKVNRKKISSNWAKIHALGEKINAMR